MRTKEETVLSFSAVECGRGPFPLSSISFYLFNYSTLFFYYNILVFLLAFWNVLLRPFRLNNVWRICQKSINVWRRWWNNKVILIFWEKNSTITRWTGLHLLLLWLWLVNYWWGVFVGCNICYEIINTKSMFQVCWSKSIWLNTFTCI